MLTIFPFGGCTVNNPLLNLQKRNLAKPIFKQVGFKRTPYALSPNALLQLYKFCTGNILIPTTIRRLTYVDSDHVPSGEQLNAVKNADVMLLEISTPFDLIFDDFVLNKNRIIDVVLSVMTHDDPAIIKNVNRWKKAMMSQKTDTQLRLGEDLLPFVNRNHPDGNLICRLLLEARCSHVNREGMSSVLDDLSALINIPIGIVLHNFFYMPDGRPVVWPSDLNDTLIQIAQERNLPVYDPKHLVAKHGTEVALASDLRHWSNDFYPTVADEIFNFINEVREMDNTAEKAVASG